MPRNDLNLPPQVLESIRAHVERAVRHAEAGYASAQESEDVVTGELGGALRTDEDQLVRVTDWQPQGTWRWSITYSKFGSGGLDSTESIVGADSILEIRVGAAELDRQKAALFQAKNTLKRDPNLLAQCVKMSAWREAAFVIGYYENGYKAYWLDDVLLAGGSLARASNGVSLAPWIVDTFIGCCIGHPELYYDKTNRRLYWTREPLWAAESWADRRVWVDFSPKHLMHIDVIPPNWRWSGAPEIEFDQISSNRLFVGPEELFGIESPFTLAELKKRRDQILKAYHSDKSHHLDGSLRSQLDRRVGETLDAYSELLPRAESTKKSSKSQRAKRKDPPVALGDPKSPTANEFIKKRRSKRVKVRKG